MDETVITIMVSLLSDDCNRCMIAAEQPTCVHSSMLLTSSGAKDMVKVHTGRVNVGPDKPS